MGINSSSHSVSVRINIISLQLQSIDSTKYILHSSVDDSHAINLLPLTNYSFSHIITTCYFIWNNCSYIISLISEIQHLLLHGPQIFSPVLIYFPTLHYIHFSPCSLSHLNSICLYQNLAVWTISPSLLSMNLYSVD